MGDREDPTENPFDKAGFFLGIADFFGFKNLVVFFQDKAEQRLLKARQKMREAMMHRHFNLKDSVKFAEKLQVRNQVEAAGGQNLPLKRCRRDVRRFLC